MMQFSCWSDLAEAFTVLTQRMRREEHGAEASPGPSHRCYRLIAMPGRSLLVRLTISKVK
jgi:hypothetical protein